MRINRRDFRAAVDAALAGLPEALRQRLDNLVVDLQDWPDATDLPAHGDHGLLLGQYTPSAVLPDGPSFGFCPPGRIKIFRRPLERVCRTRAELELEIMATVVHEVAHHFAFSEADLDPFEERVARRREELDAARTADEDDEEEDA